MIGTRLCPSMECEYALPRISATVGKKSTILTRSLDTRWGCAEDRGRVTLDDDRGCIRAHRILERGSGFVRADHPGSGTVVDFLTAVVPDRAPADHQVLGRSDVVSKALALGAGRATIDVPRSKQVGGVGRKVTNTSPSLRRRTSDPRGSCFAGHIATLAARSASRLSTPPRPTC